MPSVRLCNVPFRWSSKDKLFAIALPSSFFSLLSSATWSLRPQVPSAVLDTMLHLYLFLLAFAALVVCQQECYFAAGAANRGPANLVPCEQSGESACCLLGDTCLSGNMCKCSPCPLGDRADCRPSALRLRLQLRRSLSVRLHRHHLQGCILPVQVRLERKCVIPYDH